MTLMTHTKTQPPCKDCEQRHPGCHGSCKSYINYKEKHEQELKTIRERRAKESARTGYMTDRQFKNAIGSHNRNKVFKQHLK